MSSKIALTTAYPAKKREQLADMLFGAILKSIHEGRFKDGDRLPSEEALSAQHEVSRPTVREALARLRARGIIVSRHGAGSFVARVHQHVLSFAEIGNVADFQRCYEFRRGLESGAAGHAAARRDADNIARIQRAYEQLHMLTAETEIPVDADFAFHMAIAVAAKNPVFESVLELIRSNTLFSMSLSRTLSREQRAQRMASVDVEHRMIVDAILRQDSRAASAAMRAHINSSMTRVLGVPIDG